MEPDLDDTLPGRVSAAAAAARSGPELDTDDTIIGGLGASHANTSTPGAEAELPDTGPLDDAIAGFDVVGQYAVRLAPDGQAVSLERPVYVGRRPSTPRIRNGEIPTLLSVQSPAKEVSATHLEVRQLGSSVVVTDLRSTNGSRVSVPGRDSRTLRGGDAMVVTPGTYVDIGDGNILEIMPLTRLRYQEGSQ
ncbi:MAG: FHA domain-containing protein [Microbacteriaceae bacterium]